jgi:type I restriction enzyme, S subunit
MSWPLRSVSELCEFAVDCVNKTAPVVDKETPYKMIRTTNVKGGFIDIQDVRRVTKDTFEKWTRRSRPRYGDVVLTREAPVGEVGRCTFSDDENIFLGQRLFHYRPNPEKLDWNFLAYVLQSPEVQGRFHGRSFGATVPHVKVGDAESLLIPCPSLEEQRRIGHVLANYDDLIATNQRRIALLEDAARRIYREWFVHLRFPGHESVPVKDGVPEGWQSLALAEVCDAVGGGTPSTTRPEYWGGDVMWVTPTDVTRNDCLALLDSEKKITETGLANSSAKLVPPETILMTSRASIGFFALMDQPACTNQGFISVLPKQVNSRMFLLFHLLSRVEEMVGLATGATFKEISKKTFRALPVLWPTDELLKSFEDRAYPLIQQVRLIKKQNQQLTYARDLLLPKLMSGQLDVSGIRLPEEIAA